MEKGTLYINDEIITAGQYANNDEIEIVVMKNVRKIEEGAFYNCKNLHYVEFSEELKQIDACAFMDCNNLEAIKINNNIDLIDDFAFNNCDKLQFIINPKKNIPCIKINTGNDNITKIKPIKGVYLFKAINHDNNKIIKIYKNLTEYKRDIQYNNYNIIEVNLSSIGKPAISSSNALFKDYKNVKKIDISNLDINRFSSFKLFFYQCFNLEEIKINNWNAPNVKDMNNMFKGCSKLKEIDLSTMNFSNVKDMDCMFKDCKSLEKIIFPEEIPDNNICYVWRMFDMCSNLKEINLSVFKHFNNIVSINQMFRCCTKVEKITLPALPKRYLSSTRKEDNQQGILADLAFCRCRKLKDLIILNDTKFFRSLNVFWDCKIANQEDYFCDIINL